MQLLGHAVLGALSLLPMQPDAPTPAHFEGLWETRYGRMRLQVEGDGILGTYSSVPGARIVGEVDGDRLRFRYEEPSARGEGTFQLVEDGRALEGQWRADGTKPWTPWNGTRVEPKKRVKWLVILEARWEAGLHESEYTFGEMLRSYLTMAPRVRVRERRFHDEADFRRFAREVTFLAEPVVLLVSTHGSPKGISVGGKSIGPEAIAESLAWASNVELLHLSGCDMLRGDAAETIRAAIPESRRFPISGYKTTVDWAASALSDFTYLTFLLIRGMPPEKALAQTHVAAPYTADDEVEDCAFRPLGLALLPAERERAAR
ncbi:MAG: hypothetical protein AAGA20_25145 [Planctomycetota bacterium]